MANLSPPPGSATDIEINLNLEIIVQKLGKIIKLNAVNSKKEYTSRKVTKKWHFILPFNPMNTQKAE